MKSINGKTVDYTRGINTVSLTACPILANAPEELSPGVVVTRIELQDFICDAEDLVINGATITPMVGDTITWGSRIYRVIALDESSPPYEYTTSARDRIRIHTELVK
jgi:hypothetical protein